MSDTPLSSPGGKTLSQNVARTLRRAIILGDLPSGARLKEAAIAKRLGVSNGPVREAIRELEKLGLVVSVPRKGSFVIAWSEADVVELYTVRMLLEGYAARLAAGKITPEKDQELQGIVNRLRQEAGVLTVEESIELDLRFHEVISAASGHSRIQAILANLQGQTELFIAKTRPPGPLSTAKREVLARDHQEILDAVRSADADRGEKSVRAHLEHAPREILAGLGASAKRPNPEEQPVAED